MKYLILSFLLLSSFTKNEDKLLSKIEIIEHNGQVVIQTTYDKELYNNACEVWLQVALEARNQCDYSYLKDTSKINKTVKTYKL